MKLAANNRAANDRAASDRAANDRAANDRAANNRAAIPGALLAALVVLALSAPLVPLAGCVAAPPAIEATTVLSDTADTVGPYVVHTVVSGRVGDTVELRYVVDDGVDFTPLVMAEDDVERFRAEIPGQPAGSTVQYYVTVLRDGDRVADDPAAGAADPYRFDILPR